MPEKAGPVKLDEVDQKTFDVRAILILISHNHQTTVAERLQILFSVVLSLELQTEDFDDVVDFSVFHQLLKRFR